MIDINQFLAARLQQANNTIQAKFQAIAADTGISFSSALNRAEKKEEYRAATLDVKPYETSSSRTPESQSTYAPTLPPNQYDALISRAAERYGVDSSLIWAVIKAESNFQPNVVSRSGAMGLMQLMPATAESLGVTDPFDPAQNIDGGVRFLASMLLRWGGDVKLTLASYNCGAGGVSQRGITDLNDESQFALLPSETQNYIERVGEYLDSVGAGHILNQKMYV